jgi:hypothetical protein
MPKIEISNNNLKKLNYNESVGPEMKINKKVWNFDDVLSKLWSEAVKKAVYIEYSL